MRKPTYTEEVADVAESLVRQGPSEEQERATWTLTTLAEALVARFEHIASMSHEAVRRLFGGRDILYRQAKHWLTSPDPLYTLHKRQRDRLLVMARTAPDGAAGWLDESWFVRWPYRFWAWAKRKAPLHVPLRWNEEVDKTALFAALDDETQESFLRWADGQPNSERMIVFLKSLMAHWTEKGKRFIVLFWDRASFHTSRRVRCWIRDYNQQAKAQGLTRLIPFWLPSRSPWLMPLEAVFGSVKHRVLGDRSFESLFELRVAVECAFGKRVAAAKKRRDCRWAKALVVPQKSMSVL